MLYLLLLATVGTVRSYDDTGIGGSCGSTSIPYRISIGENGPVMSCTTPKCLGDDYFPIKDFSKRIRRQSGIDMSVSCDDYKEVVCDGQLQWTGGTMEFDNGTHRILKTECCSYRGMRMAEQIQTVKMRNGETFTGGLVKKDDFVGGFDLIKEVRKINSDERIRYQITVYRLPCIIEDSAGRTEMSERRYSGNSKPKAYSRAVVSRSKRKLGSPQDEYDPELPLGGHPYARQSFRFRGMRRRPARPVYEEYYDDEDYVSVPRRALYNRGRGEPLWPVEYSRNRAPRIHGDETYNSGQPIYNGVSDMPNVDGGSASSSLNENIESLQAPQLQSAQGSATYAEPSQFLSSIPELPQQQTAPIDTYSQTYAQSVQNSYAQPQSIEPIPPVQQPQPVYQPQQPQPVYQPQQPVYQPAAQPSYYQPAYNPSYGYGQGSSLNGIFSKMQCFSGDGEVETPSGPKAIRDLQVGDMVLSMDESMVTFAPVIMFLHRLEEEEAIFKQLTMDSGHVLKLTDYHLIYITSCKDNEVFRLVSAKDVQAGDCVHVMSPSNGLIRQKVTNSTDVTDVGIYSPLTSTGDVIVNGVLASCHSNLAIKSLQQTFFSVYRGISSTYRHYFPQQALNQEELPFGVDYLTTVIDLFLPNSF